MLAKLSVEFDLSPNSFLDLFLDYAYNEFGKPHAIKGITTQGVNTGGLKVGLGLGVRW